ncbi:MAG: ATP-binding protein, partial [Myxococcota bacterium]
LKELVDRTGADGGHAELEIGEIEPRRFLVNVTRLPDSSGVLVVFVDVTDLRRLETIRKDFVANVSHELRTPVASIRSAAETLRTSLSSDPASAAIFLEMIERNAERMGQLVEDLLDLSKLEAKKYLISLESLNLAGEVDRVVSSLSPMAAEKEIRVTNKVAPVLKIVADRRALEQVLTNLVDNAIKYSSIRSSVNVSAEAEAGKLRVVVSDTGPGIEQRHIPRLFERFYRIDAGRSRELGGTGLGLSIVKHLIEAMGGSVAVESIPGRGTTFSFTLPAA